MTNTHKKYHQLMIAGLVGGLAEVIWIGFYSMLTELQLSDIGISILGTFSASASQWAIAPVLGLLIHLLLSILLAFGFGTLLLPLINNRFKYKGPSTVLLSIFSLAIIWKINFYVLLPAFNPEFIYMVPLHISLLSKLLFGISMGLALTHYRNDEICH